MVDQRRFDNQPSDAWLDARTAAKRLGVQLRTLYAYVSRGQVRSAPAGAGRARHYAAEDIERLRARSGARAGHGAVAAGALRWGEPVLDSAITAITPGGPAYRGHPALALAARGVRLENVAELLWSGHLPAEPVDWPRVRLRAKRLARLLPRGAPPTAVMALVVPALALDDDERADARPDAVIARARRLIPCLAAALVPGLAPARVDAALAAPRVAAVLATALGRPSAAATDALEQVLVLFADHELNASCFAARVAASTEADPYACVAAALATASGARHGAAVDRVEAFAAEVARPARAAQLVRARLSRGLEVPGFGHALYPHGDPRHAPLLAAALALAPEAPRVRTVVAIADAMAAAGREHPTCDVGWAALAGALDLPPGTASAIFAVGRAAGWIAHILEQRAAGFLLRPRARYTGVPVGVS